MKRNLFLVVLIAYQLCQVNAQTLTGIDSVYLSGLSGFTKNINNIKDQVWPGMKIGPYCCFRENGPAFLMNHPTPPLNAKQSGNGIYILNQSEFGLNGATQTEINGILTAHNDYGQPLYSTINQYYAELFHELYHVYQRNYIKNLKYDNIADLLTYPEDFINYGIKQYENEILLQLFEGDPKKFNENINLFYSCRNKRLSIIGSKYLDYEKAAESVEGPAMYCEYQYMQLFKNQPNESEFIHNRYLYSVIESQYSRDKLRGKCLFTGLIQCLILSKHFNNWQVEFYASKLYLNEFFLNKFKHQLTVLPDLSSYISKSKYFTQKARQQHVDNLNAFNKQNGLKITLHFQSTPDFNGFDPMNAEAINDSTILHTTILKLGNTSNRLNFINYKVVTTITDQIWFVKSISFFLADNSSFVKDDRLIYKDNNIDINFKIKKMIKEENEYDFLLE